MDNEITQVPCSKCGSILQIRTFDIEEMAAGVWGRISCPVCNERLNEVIKDIDRVNNEKAKQAAAKSMNDLEKAVELWHPEVKKYVTKEVFEVPMPVVVLTEDQLDGEQLKKGDKIIVNDKKYLILDVERSFSTFGISKQWAILVRPTT